MKFLCCEVGEAIITRPWVDELPKQFNPKERCGEKTIYDDVFTMVRW